MLKKIFRGLVLCSVLISGCLKADNKCPFNDSFTVAPSTEVDSLQKLLQDSGIIATQHPSGFFYKISTNGTGAGVTNLCSNVTVTYKGNFFNGHIFDSTATGYVATFQLGQVIVGWQKGIALVSKGGDITLYIPPSLGYGAFIKQDSQGNVIVPANSYLKFDIHVVDIQ